METKPQPPKEREGVISALNGFIQAFNLAKEISSNTPAKAVFGSVSVLLEMIRVSPGFSLAEYILSGTRSGHDDQQSGLR